MGFSTSSFGVKSSAFAVCFSKEAFCRVFEDTFDPKISALAMKSDFIVLRRQKKLQSRQV